MGVISGNPIDVGNQIGSLVNNTALTISQLVSIIGSFGAAPVGVGAGVGPVSRPSRPSIKFADPNNVPQAVAATMAAANTAASTAFTQQFSGVTAAGVDNGAVTGYQPSGGNLKNVEVQMLNDFNNWNLPLSAEQVADMVATIAIEMQAQLGLAGTAYGQYYLNENQMIDWVVAYGEFVITDTQNGLIYAFTAALGGGWA